MKTRKRNSKFSAMIDGKEYIFVWDVSEDVVKIHEKRKRKTVSLSPQMMLDAASGQMTLKL